MVDFLSPITKVNKATIECKQLKNKSNSIHDINFCLNFKFCCIWHALWCGLVKKMKSYVHTLYLNNHYFWTECKGKVERYLAVSHDIQSLLWFSLYVMTQSEIFSCLAWPYSLKKHIALIWLVCSFLVLLVHHIWPPPGSFFIIFVNKRVCEKPYRSHDKYVTVCFLNCIIWRLYSFSLSWKVMNAGHFEKVKG